MRVGMQWWEQAGINLAGAREAAAAAVEKYGGEELRGGIKEDSWYKAPENSTSIKFNKLRDRV